MDSRQNICGHESLTAKKASASKAVRVRVRVRFRDRVRFTIYYLRNKYSVIFLGPILNIYIRVSFCKYVCQKFNIVQFNTPCEPRGQNAGRFHALILNPAYPSIRKSLPACNIYSSHADTKSKVQCVRLQLNYCFPLDLPESMSEGLFQYTKINA